MKHPDVWKYSTVQYGTVRYGTVCLHAEIIIEGFYMIYDHKIFEPFKDTEINININIIHSS